MPLVASEEGRVRQDRVLTPHLSLHFACQERKSLRIISVLSTLAIILPILLLDFRNLVCPAGRVHDSISRVERYVNKNASHLRCGRAARGMCLSQQ